MSTNLISLSLNNDQIAAINQTLGQLEGQLKDLISLEVDGRRVGARMGPKSEMFCRQTITALQLNPQILSPGLGAEQAQTNLGLLDQLRPIFQRLRQLAKRSADSEFALGSDAMVSAMRGYRVLKAFGRSGGLDDLRRELGAQRFTKGSPATPDTPAPAPVAVLKAA